MILIQAIGGVLLVPRITQWLCNTFFRVYLKSFGLHHIYIETSKVLLKPTSKTITFGLHKIFFGIWKVIA
jgi:hypothetical protein